MLSHSPHMLCYGCDVSRIEFKYGFGYLNNRIMLSFDLYLDRSRLTLLRTVNCPIKHFKLYIYFSIDVFGNKLSY